jgi:hypothetical protein
VEQASVLRRKRSKEGGREGGGADKAMVGMLLTKLLQGSLSGSALTVMITCVSQAPRNGDETYLSLKYGEDMAKLLNKPAVQPSVQVVALLTKAKKQHAVSAAIVAKGVSGKYQALREAQVAQWATLVNVLECLLRSEQGRS